MNIIFSGYPYLICVWPYSSIVGLIVALLVFFFLSPAFSKKSGGTLFLAFRGAWRMVRGSECLVGTLSP